MFWLGPRVTHVPVGGTTDIRVWSLGHRYALAIPIFQAADVHKEISRHGSPHKDQHALQAVTGLCARCVRSLDYESRQGKVLGEVTWAGLQGRMEIFPERIWEIRPRPMF